MPKAASTSSVAQAIKDMLVRSFGTRVRFVDTDTETVHANIDVFTLNVTATDERLWARLINLNTQTHYDLACTTLPAFGRTCNTLERMLRNWTTVMLVMQTNADVLSLVFDDLFKISASEHLAEIDELRMLLNAFCTKILKK